MFQVLEATSSDDTANDVSEKTSKKVADFQIEDFLNPDSSSIRRLIEHHVLKNPNLLSEMLSVKFSDLLNLFQDILVNKEGSIEAAYVELFQVRILVEIANQILILARRILQKLAVQYIRA